MRVKTLLIALGVVTLLAQPAMARGGHQSHSSRHSMQDWFGSDRRGYHNNEDRGGSDRYHFADQDRNRIRIYMQETYRGNCPPGQVRNYHKKGRMNCAPYKGMGPGYKIGTTLPKAYHRAPEILVKRLGPPPAGTFYAVVDNDVLLATEATKKILDAVTLLSAID